MEVSVVIPTCNRKQSLLSLLQDLSHSSYPISETIIVDSGKEKLTTEDIAAYPLLNICYLESQPSVCIQRNIGIQRAKAPWIFLCDDDLQVPDTYIYTVMNYIKLHPEAGAVTGLVLQRDTGEWMEQFPVKSSIGLICRFIFQLSIWGEITLKGFFIDQIKMYYQKKGNHLSRAGWPVITDFSGDYFIAPVYGLGASIVKKQWLMCSPYDEVLDTHGIGDNYGVAVGFPGDGIRIIKNAFVYHHKISINRIQRPLQYYRRILALHYFFKTKSKLKHIKIAWFQWSLLGNGVLLLLSGSIKLALITFKVIIQILFGINPYLKGKKKGKKVIMPKPF